MSTALLAAFAVILCILFRILNVNSTPSKPRIWCNDFTFLESVTKICPLINEPYTPTRLWGFSGHVQTIVHSVIGRVRCPWPIGERVFLTLNDNTTLTYDLYQPISLHEDDITIAICPGIGNTSESVYIRTFVHWAQRHGYRACVLNHVGALSSVPVTSPRIFSYGHTGDYNAMVQNLLERHPLTKIVCIGFSLGGNLVTKYMGETDRVRPQNIIGGISICQGYSATEDADSSKSFSEIIRSPKTVLWLPYLYQTGTKFLLNWQNFRRFYLYVMTENMKNIILRHRSVLLNEDVKRRFGLQEQQIISAATLPELDDAYTRKIHNFDSIDDLYRWSSSVNYLENIKTPMVFINAKDDPIVPELLLNPIKTYASEHPKAMYIELAHGGHLGFYEGGFIYPNPVTWLDRALVSLVGSLFLYHSDTAKKIAD